MHCPFCTADDTRVVDSRPADGGSAIRRRRECLMCGHRFTTYERPAVTALVAKRDGRSEPFDPAKVRRGVENALADRPTASGEVERLIASITDWVHTAGTVPADEIGRMVLAGLRDIDEVAYVRFASVYKEFTGVGDFEREVAALEADV